MTDTPVDPPHWLWRVEVRDPTVCVVVDIDGVVADAEHRQHLLDGHPRLWNDFFDAAGADELIDEMAAVVRLLREELVVVLLTARPIRIRELTTAWLAQHGLRWDLLVMRPDHDFTTSPAFKRTELRRLLEAGWQVQLAFDDDPRNVEMFRSEGVECLYVHSGYYP